MNIVVLDGYTLNPSDLSWNCFKELGNLNIYDRTPDELILKSCSDAEVIITNKTPISADTINKLGKLRYIGVLATGYNIVDINAARVKNIPVTNIPAYGTTSVAQMVFAHILNLTHHVMQHSASVSDGDWALCPDFCYWNFPLIELNGLTLGIIGYGKIGKATADIGRAFGMKILAYDSNLSSIPSSEGTLVSIEDLFAQSDVVSLHCPLTRDNIRFVNAKILSKMKKTAFLINTSRGQLIDESALADALNSGKIAGAGLDVLSVEPPEKNNPLLNALNCYVTPHIAWATYSARKRLMQTAIDNLKSFLNGKTINVVN
jgi:glycerate dehydrogenase